MRIALDSSFRTLGEELLMCDKQSYLRLAPHVQPES
jgi:hypothetical protein